MPFFVEVPQQKNSNVGYTTGSSCGVFEVEIIEGEMYFKSPKHLKNGWVYVNLYDSPPVWLETDGHERRLSKKEKMDLVEKLVEDGSMKHIPLYWLNV